MHNDTIPHATTGTTLTQWIARSLRHAADLMAPETVKRQSIEAVKTALAYDVELSLLSAEAEEERARHTVNMLRERVSRLKND